MTRTRGNVIIEEIKLGDIHYEFEYGCYIKCEVISLPKLDEDGNWIWKSKNLLDEEIIDYLVNPNYTHYSSKLYDYMAYEGCKQI